MMSFTENRNLRLFLYSAGVCVFAVNVNESGSCYLGGRYAAPVPPIVGSNCRILLHILFPVSRFSIVWKSNAQLCAQIAR